MKKVMFVCLGNICRSPAAEGIFKDYLDKNNIQSIDVDSSGTSAFHNGENADSRMRAAANFRGVSLSSISSHFTQDHLEKFDLILAMDRSNQKDILKICNKNNSNKVKLFSDFKLEKEYIDVPDPYYGGDFGFNNVLDIIEDALPKLTEYINGI
jgi:protein-tyrosine phosphatase